MCPSLQETSTTASDELHTCPIQSPVYVSTRDLLERTTRTRPNTPFSTPQPPASPTPPITSPRHITASTTSTCMLAIESKVQPNLLSHDFSAPSISFHGNPSCPTRSEPEAASLSRHLDSGSVEPMSFSTKYRQSVIPSFSFPGASFKNSTTTYDRIFQDSTHSQCASTASSSAESITSTPSQTPNVYINGLPPHFSEQQLFALARPFGNIKSVRTFTRHVSEKPTGYGFVLFDDVDSAQSCIEGLRKYRNLHPSFSKQVHRIPGTEYAQHNAVQSTCLDESSFKSRMEKLKDAASTNLYIEGLPLSIDEESLAALMLPFKIKSSRFFKTKLSNPPRIIAFVRLETRAAAEETIERLHGRMVRGWNDPGCRISVRFADSAEQRDLRRSERTLKNGDQSPSRLTIAQAALLNLRGQDLQANIHDVVGTGSHRFTNSRSNNRTAFNHSSDSASFPTSSSLPSNLCYPCTSPLPSTSDLSIASEMDNLLQSIQSMSYDDMGMGGSMRSLGLNNEYLISQQAQLRDLASAALLSPDPLLNTLPRGHTQAHNGFTPAEELILEAHAQHLQLQAQLPQSPSKLESVPSLKKGNVNVRSYNPEPLELPSAKGLVEKTMVYQNVLPTISEDEFHAMGQPSRNLLPTSYNIQGLVDSCPGVSVTSSMFMRPPNRAVTIVPPPPGYEEPGKRPKGHQRAERTIGSKQILECPSSSFNTRQTILSADSKSHTSPTCPRNIDNYSNDHNNTSTVPELQQTYLYSHGDTGSSSDENKRARFRSSSASQICAKKFPHLGELNPAAKGGPRSPIPVVSPALTYSSRTPSTLSPATPFFGSFPGSHEIFEVMTVANEDVTERKLKARVLNK